jgi:predicted RecA/RadA family phage recombinase
MSTTAQNNIVLQQKMMYFPIDQTGANDINQGDQVYMDTSAKLIKSLGSSDDTHAATFVGVAAASSYIQPYSTKKYQPQIPVLIAGVATYNTTSGDTLNEGDAVYAGADAQTVTNQAATNIIGYVKMRQNQSAVAGGAGVTIDVQIVPKYPTTAVA